MREIKFRAWIGDAFEYFALDSLYWRGEDTGEYDFPKGEIVEQFTGLRDKNGREIYEGDIVKQFLEDGSVNKTFVVQWEQAGFDLPSWKPMLMDYYSTLSYEIIGNNHENPELVARGGE